MGWIRIDRVTWAERALWVALVAAAIAPVAMKPSIGEVARAYVDAINRGDVDAAMALIADGVAVRPIPGGRSEGPAATREMLEYRAALNERWRISSWRDTGKEVHAGVEITNDAWTLVGTHPRTTVILVVRNGRLLYELAQTDRRRMLVALRPFLDWAAEEHPAELEAVWRDKSPVWRADAAGRLLDLLREWRTAEPGVAEGASGGQG